jgi:hypothetical protein
VAGEQGNLARDHAKARPSAAPGLGGPLERSDDARGSCDNFLIGATEIEVDDRPSVVAEDEGRARTLGDSLSPHREGYLRESACSDGTAVIEGREGRGWVRTGGDHLRKLGEHSDLSIIPG